MCGLCGPISLSFRGIFGLISLALLLSHCSVEPDEPTLNESLSEQYRSDCDKLGPLIFVHGALSAGDLWALQFRRLLSNNTCQQNFYVFDWNASIQETRPDQWRLEAFIDRVLEETGEQKVKIVAHATAGGMLYEFLGRPSRAAKVAAYAHLGSFQADSLPGPPDNKVPILNLWSPDDQFIRKRGDIAGARNVFLIGKDHYQTATSKETFHAVYEFFSGGLVPLSNTPRKSAEPVIRGRALEIGGNKPSAHAYVEVYEVIAGTGQRRRGSPDFTFFTDSLGNWGPVTVKPDTYYEFFLQPSRSGARPIHFYREPFFGDNPLVYFRTPPGTDHPTHLFFSIIPKDDKQSVMGIFSASQTVFAQRDAVLAGGFKLSNEELSRSDEHTSAFFLFDDGDSDSSGDPYTLYNITPFLSGVDLFIPGSRSQYTKVLFNGRTLNLPNWPSKTDGLVFAVFE